MHNFWNISFWVAKLNVFTSFYLTCRIVCMLVYIKSCKLHLLHFPVPFELKFGLRLAFWWQWNKMADYKFSHHPPIWYLSSEKIWFVKYKYIIKILEFNVFYLHSIQWGLYNELKHDSSTIHEILGEFGILQIYCGI